MLIDNSGNAWIPSDRIMSLSKFSYNLDKNVIIGNINNPDDWPLICSYLDRDFKEKNKLTSTLTKMPIDKNESRKRFINSISNNGEYGKLISLKNELGESQIEEKKQLQEGKGR